MLVAAFEVGSNAMEETKISSVTETLKQTGEHSLYFKKLGLGFTMRHDIDQLQVLREQQKVLQLTCGPHRDVQELAEFRASAAATAFRDVCGNRTCGTPDLTAESEPFIGGQLPRQPVNPQDELVAAAPHFEFAEVLHNGPGSAPLRSACIYLQLNTDNRQLELRSSHVH